MSTHVDVDFPNAMYILHELANKNDSWLVKNVELYHIWIKANGTGPHIHKCVELHVCNIAYDI